MRKIGQTLTFLILIIAVAALVVFMIGAGRRRRAAEEMKAKGEQFCRVAWNTGDADLLDEMYAPDVVIHNPPNPDIEGLEGYKGLLLGVRRGFPDFQSTVQERIIEGDTQVIRTTWRGTHTGDLFGMPPTGKEVMGTGCEVEHWVDGKVVEVWKYDDNLGFFQQLGFKLVPPK